MIRSGTGVLALAALTGFVQAPPRGPVGYWTLDEAAGPSANAAGAYGAGAWSGAASSTTPTTANTYADPRCLSFDGVDDHVVIANSPELENVQEGSYTMSAWVNPADVPAEGTNEGRYAILYKTGLHGGLGYTRDGDGLGRFVLEHWLDGNQWRGCVTGITYEPAAWYHVAAVVNRATGTCRLYVGGEERGLGTFTPDAAAREYGTVPWHIGIASPGAAYGSYRWAYKGLIDDVRLYGRALTAEEVRILALGVPRPENVQAQAEVQQVTLTWDPPAAPAGYAAYTYNIYRTFEGTRTRIATDVSTDYYTDTGATTTGNGETYSYEVTAVSAAESGPTAAVSAIPFMPIPRTNDHTEGLFEDRCACGSSMAPGGVPAAWAAAVLVLAAFLGRRRAV